MERYGDSLELIESVVAERKRVLRIDHPDRMRSQLILTDNWRTSKRIAPFIENCGEHYFEFNSLSGLISVRMTYL